MTQTSAVKSNPLANLLKRDISLAENVRVFYWAMTILFVCFSAFTALVMFVWTAPAGDYVSDWPGFGWFRPIENYYQISAEHTGWIIEKRLHHLIIWYLFAYLLSFLGGLIPKFERRPLKPVTMLHAGMGFFMGALMAGGTKYFAEESLGLDLIASMLAVVVLFIIPGVYISGALFMEHVFVLALSKLSDLLHKHHFVHLADILLSLALRLRPGDKRLHRNIGLSLFSDDNYQDALKHLEPLFQENQDDTEILAALEKSYRKLEREEEALEVQKHLLELEPERENIRLHAVRILSHQGHHRQAVEMLDATPGSPSIEISILRLDEEISLNDEDGALATANVIHGLDSGSEHYAIEAYKKVVEKWPNCEQALDKLGKLEIAHRRDSEGYAQFERLVQCNPYRQDIRQLLVQYYRSQKQVGKTEPHVRSLINSGHYTEDVALLYGEFLVREQKYDDALAHFQYARELYPGDYRFPFYEAKLLYKTGAIHDSNVSAAEALSLAKENSPNKQSNVKNFLEQVHRALSKNELELWRDRCYRQSENIDSHLGYIQALAHHGQMNNALSEARIFLEKHPDSRDALISNIQQLAADMRANFPLMDFLFTLRLENKQYDEAFGLARRIADVSSGRSKIMSQYCERILKQHGMHQKSLEYMLGIAQSQDKQEWVYQIAKRLARIAPEKQTRYTGMMLKSAILLKDVENALQCAKRPLDSLRHFPSLVQLLIDAGELESASEFIDKFEHENPDDVAQIRQLRTLLSNRMDNQQTIRMTRPESEAL